MLNGNSNFLNTMITGDTSRKPKCSHHSEDIQHCQGKNAQQVHSDVKIMLTVFIDFYEVVNHNKYVSQY